MNLFEPIPAPCTLEPSAVCFGCRCKTGEKKDDVDSAICSASNRLRPKAKHRQVICHLPESMDSLPNQFAPARKSSYKRLIEGSSDLYG
jgi:hypothetical protein